MSLETCPPYDGPSVCSPTIPNGLCLLKEYTHWPKYLFFLCSVRQSGRPEVFFSRTLSRSERWHSAIEKEVYAIVEALRKLRYYLIGRYFKLITDQKSVSFMFNPKTTSKIKNEKTVRWRVKLSCYSFDITYRPGKKNAAVDTLSRVCGLVISTEDLQNIPGWHNFLCITRITHVVRSRNLLEDEDVKRITNSCRICAVNKPRFYPNPATLIKAIQPFERLNLDFKGLLPSKTNK